MTWLDIIILFVFIASLAIGFWKGAIAQVGSLGGIIFGILLCHLGGNQFAGFISGAEVTTYTDKVLAHVILFIVGWLFVKCIASLFKSITHKLHLGGFDRLGGALLSLFKWMLVMSLLLNLWVLLKPSADPAHLSTLGNGKAIVAILKLAPWIIGS